MTQATEPKTIYRTDYRAPVFTLDSVDLWFELGDSQTDVRSTLAIRRAVGASHSAPLRLDGQKLDLTGLWLDGRALAPEDYSIDADSLQIDSVPDAFKLTVHTRIYPHKNKALEGLYRSNGIFCTQCEAEGFRRITYYLDRPDVLAPFKTKLIADREDYPVLLSNGNRVAAGDMDDGRHWVEWHDPHPKPSYLFALVAGRLACLSDQLTTRAGRKVDLEIYVEAAHLDQCHYAMESLKRAMRWDENVYGLEYDLDTYMIVAVGDFNMGAMENKGLNIFNTVYVLANTETATDNDFAGVESVIGHEYFHNWTGNRVTCRDWFQLSLKEGLTVFRDQEFSADMGSRAVNRIDNVRNLRAAQFPEDSGPMAHPVRPDSYIEINNFYTATVYNKGAEVVRMIHTLVGQSGFRRGMDLYIRRHDGQAATCDDFVQAMEDANDINLRQFRRWYSQAGTPVLAAHGEFDPEAASYTLHFEQTCPATPGQSKKEPFHIPVQLGLLAPAGAPLPLKLDGENQPGETSRLIEITDAKQAFRFVNVEQAPVPSILRGFSAPVNLRVDYSDDELRFLFAHDTDEFNRWEAGQALATRAMIGWLQKTSHEASRRHEKNNLTTNWKIDSAFSDAFAVVLNAPIDPAFRALALTLPSVAYIIDQLDNTDPTLVFAVRDHLRGVLAERLYDQFLATYREHQHPDTSTSNSNADVGRRALKNLCLSYLVKTGKEQAITLCLKQLHQPENMTDELGALAPLVNHDGPQRIAQLAAFYSRWQNEPLVVDKWFSLQASCVLDDALSQIKSLLSHPAYSGENPNKVRALVGAFVRQNPLRFHAADGSGYVFLADQILQIDQYNSQLAAGLTRALSRWRKLDRARQRLICRELERIQQAPVLSPDVFELVSKSLAS